MITLTTPTDLKVLAVLVPRSARQINAWKNEHDPRVILAYDVEGNPRIEYLNCFCKPAILGTLHMDNGLPVFSEGFDASRLGFKAKVWDRDDPYWQPAKSEIEGAYSWLTVELPRQADRYLVNPMGDRPIRRIPFMAAGFETDRDREALAEYDEQLYSWRAAEEKRIKEKIVFVLVK